MTRKPPSLRPDAAKFRPAPLRRWTIHRRRLLEILRREASGVEAVLIEAPPGFGKSSLMRQWFDDRKAHGWACAWLSLDGHDDDPNRFAALLLGAIGEFYDDGPILGLSGALDLRRVVEHVMALDFSRRELAVFLDDFHHVAHPEIRDALSRLIEFCSPGFQLIVASRTLLPLPRNRARLAGQALCLREADLALDDDEAAALLANFCMTPLAAAAVRRLRARTRGWAAMLHLAGLAIADSDDPESFIDAFSGGDDDVSKYLCEVILDLQPESIRAFLLSTAVFDVFSPDLCEALLGIANARALIAEVDARRLLLQPQDRRQHCYAYHAVFREFLLVRFDIERPGERIRLLRQAGAWFYARGEIAPAVEHALRGEDHENAALYASAHVLDIALRHGEFTTVRRWISALPDHVLDRYPSLKLGLAWAFIFLHRHDQARALVESVEASEQNINLDHGAAGRKNATQATCLVIRGVNAAAGDRHDEAAKILRAFDLGADPSLLNERALAATAGAYGALAFGWLREARRLSREADELIAIGDFRYADGWNRIVKAMLGLAEDRLDHVAGPLTAATARFGPDSLITKLLAICRADALYRLGALDDARRALAEASEAGFAHVTLELGEMAMRTMARLALADERYDEAEAILTRGRADAERLGLGRLADLLAGELVGALLRMGRKDDAWAVDERHRLCAPATDKFPLSVSGRMLARTRLVLSHGDAAGALRLARALLNRARPMHNLQLEIPALCLAGAAHRQIGDEDEARRLTTQARMTAEQKGMLRLFHDESYLVPSGGDEPGTGDEENFDEARPDDSPALSNREGHVLSLMSKGLTNKDIASRLALSEETVKWHLRNISRKLNARNRTHAVQIAQRSGLLRPI